MRWIDEVRHDATFLGVKDLQVSVRGCDRWKTLAKVAVGFRLSSANGIRIRVSIGHYSMLTVLKRHVASEAPCPYRMMLRVGAPDAEDREGFRRVLDGRPISPGPLRRPQLLWEDNA